MAKKKAAKRSARETAKRAPAKRPGARKPAKRRAPAMAKKAAPGVDRRAKSGPERLRLRSAAPGFTVNDIEKSLAFYSDVLGFHPKERWIRDGKLAGVEMVAGAVTLYLGQDDWLKGRERVKGVGFRVYCTTAQDIDALAARIKAKGGVLIEEIQQREWGSRDFAVADPDGFKITISTPIE